MRAQENGTSKWRGRSDGGPPAQRAGCYEADGGGGRRPHPSDDCVVLAQVRVHSAGAPRGHAQGDGRGPQAAQEGSDGIGHAAAAEAEEGDADAGLDDLVARLRGVSLAGLNAQGDVNNDPLAAVAEAVLAVQPATAEAALKDWIVFDDADEVIIDMLTGDDVDDVVDDLLAEEGDDDQSDDEAAAVAGPTNSETFATLNEKARAAGQAAFAAQHSSWTAATRQYVLDAAAPFLFLMEHSPALEAVQLMQRLKAVLLKPTQKRKQAALHSFFSKVNRREALVAAARASGGDGAGVTGTVRAVVAVTPTPSLTTRAAVWRTWGKSLARRSIRLATMG